MSDPPQEMILGLSEDPSAVNSVFKVKSVGCEKEPDECTKPEFAARWVLFSHRQHSYIYVIYNIFVPPSIVDRSLVSIFMVDPHSIAHQFLSSRLIHIL